ncbi:MAG TPA: class I SAM-dependent methyltransferase [Anaerolineae bacterium]|nr:class I SAM-dependent methyltransferase [Anaerolineae bacterium]
MTENLDTVIATLRSWQTPSVDDTAGRVFVSAPAISANGTAAPNGTGFGTNGSTPDASLAFQHSGRQGEQRTADYGSAGKSKHQQYFTPQWVAECFPEIVKLVTQPHGRPASVLDPTGGVGRLLAVFKGHPVLGIELDESMAAVAKRVLGKEQVRTGDILAYAPYLESFDVAALNPPYDLRWQPLPGQSFEMTAGSGLIESQKAVLEVATRALQGNGILIGLFSRRFFEVNADAREYLFRKYTVLALIDLPDTYKPEYGIEASSVLVVALRSAYPIRNQQPVTGSATDRTNLLYLVGQAAAKLPPWQRVYPYGIMPTVPHLEMAVEVDTTATLQVSARGVRPATPWAALWADVLDCTTPGYSPAEGTQTGVYEGIASLPNLLLGGVDPNLERLKTLGFGVACDEAARIRLDAARKRFERERLPLRLDPVELLAYYDEGWYTAEKTVTVGKHTIEAGKRYHLTLRWQRATEHVKTEVKEDRKDVLHTYVDLGYSIFELRPDDGSATIVLKETSVQEMEA